MHVKLRHAAAGALVLCAAVGATPFVSRAQTDSSFGSGWEEVAVTAGPSWSRHGFYGSAVAFGGRLGGAVRVATHLAIRVDAQGVKTFVGAPGCTSIASGYVPSGCSPDIGALWGGTIGLGYLDVDATGVPLTFVSVAPGFFNISGTYGTTGGSGFGLRASIERAVRTSSSGAPVFGIGVRAVMNVHHDTVLDIPVELGGWSW